MLPVRGDIFELKSSRGSNGHEQAGKRYGVVVQATELGTLSTSLVAPTSRSASDSIFRPRIQVRRQTSKVLVDQIGAVDLSRLGRRVGRVGTDEQWEIDDAIRRGMGFD